MRIGKRIMGPTSGLPLLEARTFLVQTVIPAISYACPVWFIAQGGGKLLEKHQAKLTAWQNRFLRLIEGAYRSTQIAFLEHELNVYSLDLELWRRSCTFLAKLRTKEVWKTICAARETILVQERCKLRNRAYPDVLYERELLTNTLYQQCSADFDERWEKVRISKAASDNFEKAYKNTMEASVDSHIRKMAFAEMVQRWETERATFATHPHPPATTKSGWEPKKMCIHAGLTRFESMALIRLRTEVVRLRNYLFKLSSQASPTSFSTITLNPAHPLGQLFGHYWILHGIWFVYFYLLH